MKDEAPGSLLATTHSLLRIALEQKGATIISIYNDTGIPYYWLKKFSAGEFQNPSVNRIQKLYEYLSGTKLNLVA